MLVSRESIEKRARPGGAPGRRPAPDSGVVPRAEPVAGTIAWPRAAQGARRAFHAVLQSG